METSAVNKQDVCFRRSECMCGAEPRMSEMAQTCVQYQGIICGLIGGEADITSLP